MLRSTLFMNCKSNSAPDIICGCETETFLMDMFEYERIKMKKTRKSKNDFW